MDAGGGHLAGLTNEARSEALQRYEVLRPALEEGVSLAEAARTVGVSPRSAQRWMAAYRGEGLAGLAPHPRSDRGHCHGLPRELEGVVEGLALKKPRLSTAAVHRRAVEIAVRQGWPEPSYAQVYRLARNLDPAMVKLAHEGAKSYGQSYELLYRREAESPNEVWQADHTPLDVWVKGNKGDPKRPWLTVILDDYSRAIAGYHVGLKNPTALGTALTLRRAIWHKEQTHWQVCGIPETFYSDHGSDFESRHMEQVAADIKMRLAFSIAGQPRGRGKIERFFRTVDQMFLCLLPGYSPEGAPTTYPKMTLSELDEAFASWLVEFYHQRMHGETGQRPQERWEAGGFLPRMPDCLEQLDLLLLTVAKSRRVGRDGIRFEGFRYTDPLLTHCIGEDVVVRYDPQDLAEIRVYQDSAFLCTAVCEELAGYKISFSEIARARNARRRELRDGIKERTSLAKDLLAGRPYAPPAATPPSRRDADHDETEGLAAPNVPVEGRRREGDRKLKLYRYE